MKRSIAAGIPLLALTAALLTPGGAATGAPPVPPEPPTTTKAAGEACAFPIQVDVTGKIGFIDLPHNHHFTAIQTAPGQRTTVTNLDTGKSVTFNTTGAFRVVSSSGGVDVIEAGGHNFLYGEPQAGVTAFATTGPIEFTAVDNHIVEKGLDLSGARVRDICAELA
jgi:hypothetical protein